MILSMEGLTFASALELNIGTIYFHIKLDNEADDTSSVQLYSHGI
jgi:hypothetical protein